MNRFDRYVGLPYAKDARGPEEFDCLGLCQLIYRQELGIYLPEHLGSYRPPAERPDDGSMQDDDAQQWRKIEVSDAQPFDLVLIRESPWHVGLVVQRGDMIHMPVTGFSVVQRFDTKTYEKRVEGVYRHPSRVAQ